MNTAQIAIFRLAFEDMHAHFELGLTAQEAVERLVAIAYDALSAVEKIKAAE